ncbi:hypothetical protein I4U23_011754 [Adineta vaga]|nr:hypothetical protein I4U23_011754 [Adineta vaga]
MNTQYKLRRADISDIDTLSTLCQRTYRETFVEDFAIPYPDDCLRSFYQQTASPEYFTKKISDSQEAAVWLIEEEQTRELVAYAVVSTCHSDDIPHPDVQTNKDGMLNRLYVQRQYQKHGLGQQLMNVILSWFEEHHPNQPIWLTVFSENHKAQKFYARYGFTKVGEFDFYVGQWIDREFIMKRQVQII